MCMLKIFEWTAYRSEDSTISIAIVGKEVPVRYL